MRARSAVWRRWPGLSGSEGARSWLRPGRVSDRVLLAGAHRVVCIGTAGEGALMVIPCLWVPPRYGKAGAGRAMMAALEAEARLQGGRKGVCVQALAAVEWFMPAAFLASGVRPGGRIGRTTAPVEAWDQAAMPPRFCERCYAFEPTPGGGVTSISFTSHSAPPAISRPSGCARWLPSLATRVLLREYCASDPAIGARYGIGRAILVNGRRSGWGYEAPREGIREAIAQGVGGYLGAS